MKKKASSLCFAGWSDKLKELIPFGIGVILMGLAVFAAMKRVAAVEDEIQKRSEPVAIVVASVPIPAGADFNIGNLASKTIPASGTGMRNVPTTDFELLLGAKSKSSIDPGEPILWTDVEEPFDVDLFSKTVHEGKRALTLTVDTNSIFSGLLRPGDRIDFLAKDSDNRFKWIRDIKVVAMDRNLKQSVRPEEVVDTSAVTIMVTVEEGAAIAEASSEGQLFWFLRNPNDNAAPRRNHATHQTVELWHGGARVLPASPSPVNPYGGKPTL